MEKITLLHFDSQYNYYFPIYRIMKNVASLILSVFMFVEVHMLVPRLAVATECLDDSGCCQQPCLLKMISVLTICKRMGICLANVNQKKSCTNMVCLLVIVLRRVSTFSYKGK